VPVLVTPSQLNRVFRFGEYELSVRALELRKNGEVVRLQQQPLRVLLALLEYSGEVITRDEIRDRVWPDANVQDFENSLRVAVTKLRQALGDDTEKPQFIETLPRRGYRWLHPVTVHENHLNGVEADPADGAVGEMVTVLGGRRIGQGQAADGGVGFGNILLTLTLLGLALVAGQFLRHRPSAPEPKIVPLTTYPGLEFMPAISPDGKRVAFQWTGAKDDDPYGVYVKLIGDDRARRLTVTPEDASDGNPVWSPDGKLVYFYRRGGPQSGIYVAPADGGPATLVVATSMYRRRLRRNRFDIAPSGKMLVYPDEIPGQDTAGLFLLDLGTMQSRPLTVPPPSSEGDGDPAFSHDGKSLVFQRDTVDRQQLYVTPVEGGAARPLAANYTSDFMDGMAWTMDDREVVVGGNPLRRITVAGEPAVTKVSYVPGLAVFPSLRGNRLAYVQSNTNANVWKLELKDATHVAGEPTKLITSTRQQAAAAFSPDGRRIAFQSDRSGSWEIWVSDRDGSNSMQLTHFGNVLAGTPRWSPDGRQIVFDAQANGLTQVYIIYADGGTPLQLTHDQAGSEVPSWSRDGKWIYYSNVRRGGGSVWRVPAAGGTPQLVTSGTGIYAVESPDGKYVYYSRSAMDPTIWRIPVNGGDEAQVPDVPKPFDCSHWVVVTSGIYTVNFNGDLEYYDFAKHNVTKVLHDAKFLTDWSMAISPDGHEIAWAQVDDRAADLMLVENFR
jgi:Tol biopolymer transport system component/DNA-binding winged helix-turn-helix (wHTH) protein